MIKPLDIQIRFSDIDLMGHVNNAVYLNYFESARMHYLVSVLGKDWNWQKNGIILKTNEIEYILPVFLTDKPQVKVTTEHIGNKSFTLSYELKVDTFVKTRGKSVLVGFDFEKQSSRELDAEFIAALEQLKA